MKQIFAILCMWLVASTSMAQTTNPAPYCGYDFSSGTPVATGGITNVTFGTINNTTGVGSATSLYQYYNNITPPQFTMGVTYNLNITFNSCLDGEPMYGAVYIDYNANSVFEPGEIVWNQGTVPLPVSNSGGAPITIPITVTIPSTATADTVRMRVIRFEDSSAHSGAANFVNNYSVAPCHTAWTTTYNYKGEVEDYDIELLPGTLQPTVITTAATGVTMTGATLNGDVNMNGLGTGLVSFEYGTALTYGNTINATPPSVSGTTINAISAIIGTLAPGTLYHYRAKVVDGLGNVYYGNDQTFVTVAVPVPIVNTLNTVGIAQTVATIRGNANMNGVAGFGALEFEYGTSTAYGSSVLGTPASVTGTATVAFSSNLTTLTPNTLYHYRAKLTEGSNVYYGADSTFTTLPLPDPVAVTITANNILESSATLVGSANAMNLGTAIVGFEYGLTTSYGTTVSATPASLTGNIMTLINANLTSLTPSTTYHYRAFISVNGNTKYGIDKTFTTRDLTLPNVSTAAATNITTSSVQLNGFVNPQNFGTCILNFEWGTTPALGNSLSATPTTVSGNQLVAVTSTLSSAFTNNTTYYYRLIADIAGVFYSGTILSFTLPPALGIDDLEKQFTVYPNPTRDHLTVKVDGENITGVKLYDVMGRTLLIQDLEPKSIQTISNLDFPEGLYILEVYTNKNSYKQQISIESK